MGFSRQEYWSGLPCTPPGDLPYPGIEPGSSTLQADSLPSEPPWKPNIGLFKCSAPVSSLAMPFSRGSSQARDQIQVFHIAGRFFTIWATREVLFIHTDIIAVHHTCAMDAVSSLGFYISIQDFLSHLPGTRSGAKGLKIVWVVVGRQVFG